MWVNYYDIYVVYVLFTMYIRYVLFTIYIRYVLFCLQCIYGTFCSVYNVYTVRSVLFTMYTRYVLFCLQCYTVSSVLFTMYTRYVLFCLQCIHGTFCVDLFLHTFELLCGPYWELFAKYVIHYKWRSYLLTNFLILYRIFRKEEILDNKLNHHKCITKQYKSSAPLV